MTLVVVNFTEHQALALFGALLIGIGLGYLIAAWRITDRVNGQWFAERERVHREREAAGKFKEID